MHPHSIAFHPWLNYRSRGSRKRSQVGVHPAVDDELLLAQLVDGGCLMPRVWQLTGQNRRNGLDARKPIIVLGW